MSAERSARSVSHAEGVDKVRALQRVLYRSAKQDPKRRFHALYDKVARGDVMWQAWVGVAANGGSPGVDGVSIASIEAEGVAGVRQFLDVLAAELEAKTYRPQPLRRVHIAKPGKAGETRPLGIPAIRDRVVMAAAKLVLEPIFEGDFLPASFGFRPKHSTHQALEAVRVAVNRGGGVGARCRHQGMLRRDRPRRPHGAGRTPGSRPADVEAAAKLAASGGVRGWSGLRHGGRHSTGLTRFPPAGQHRPPCPR
jgi:hypothetical protein